MPPLLGRLRYNLVNIGNPRRAHQSFYNEQSRRKTTQSHAPRRPTFYCYYCGLEGHIKVDCRKMANDIKSQRMQTKKIPNGKNVKKRNYFQNIENRNLQRKKDLAQQSAKRQVSQPSKVKRVWVRKDDPKCLVIHTALRAGSSSRWYLDSGCSRHMSGERELIYQT